MNELATREICTELDRDGRMQLVWELYIQNLHPRAIAKYVGVSVEQVVNDVDFVRCMLSEDLSRLNALELTAEAISKYRELYALARKEAEIAVGGDKSKFLRVAKDILNSEQKLLQDIGAIPTEPQKLEYTIKGQIQHEHRHIMDVRTEEEINQDIKKLFETGLVMREDA